MDANTIIQVVTLLVTLVLGLVSKNHPKINNKLIPLQNCLVGIISAIIYYTMTKDLNLTIVAVGIGAGGAYDLIKNTIQLVKDTDWYKELIKNYFSKGE